jgi:hypothetical protein
MTIDRKALIRAYKESRRPAGIFVVRNIKSGRVLFGPAVDLPAMLNRQRFQLQGGAHPDRELLADWNELGPDAFEFDVLDRLECPEDPTYDAKDDLTALAALWFEKLTAAGTPLYPWARRNA